MKMHSHVKIDWDERALDSEIEYSRARGGTAIVYPNFIHIYNNAVPWSGDYNRTVGVRVSSYESFREIVQQVETIHKGKQLDKPDRYDIFPPVLDEKIWGNFLSKTGYKLRTVVFFYSRTITKELPSDVKLYSPSGSEYIEWFHEQQRSREYYDADWFQQLKPLQLNFIKRFKPYWLLQKGEIIGWVYCANLGEYCRLFEVEIRSEFRGHGFGRILLDQIRAEGEKQRVEFILLQTNEKLRKFYERVGFKECTRNSVIRLI